MKTRFNTYDIVCSIAELQKLVGMRVNNIYDVDNKTYLFKLQRSEEKAVLLIESGIRYHLTNYEWPKHMAPSGFSMKMRKHLKNKRLESIKQLGIDRIVDLQFGSGEAAYHVILELYDRGNIVLTDYERTILYVLRPHTEGEVVRFAIKEKYPENRARESSAPDINEIQRILENAKDGDNLKKILMSNSEYGPALIEHVMLRKGFANNTKIGKEFIVGTDMNKVKEALDEAEEIFQNVQNTGYIIQKKEERPSTQNITEKEYFYSNQEFHPFLYEQLKNQHYIQYETFNQAVDEFFSTLQGQKIEMKALQQEREAIKKLDNVKRDHNQRLLVLEKTQENDKVKAELITKNSELVDQAIFAVQNALARQMPWEDLEALVKESAAKGDLVATHIKQLKLKTNHISIQLSDPYPDDNNKPLSIVIDVDLALSAYANARRYYDQKRSAAKKQQKTIESQGKALKSAEKKTKQVLKEVQTTTNINKARKVYWFEKFFWFISSENYLVIGGRDQQQNELIVKRYMKPSDIYVHADVHGASSIVIKNPTGKPVPPKTLNEAGTMAICYSVAWDAKVLTNAYWVMGEQVSKTAPTGEYLTTGSFMVRGKKNFLPPSHLILGMAFLFRLEDGSVERHRGERKVLNALETELAENELQKQQEAERDEEEVIMSDDSDEEFEKKDNDGKLEKIEEDESVEGEEDVQDKELVQDIEENKDIKEEELVQDIEESKDESSSDEDDNKFPDTQIKIEHIGGMKVNILTETTIDSNTFDTQAKITEQLESDKKKQRQRTNSELSTRSKASNASYNNEHAREESKKQIPAKRGQRSKLKKIKEKYKDQDDEERQLRMQILQSAGPMTKKGKKAAKEEQIKIAQNKKIALTARQQIKKSVDLQDDDETVVQAEVDMIDYLTGIPTQEDELLFAIPVIAPYNTLTNYKFKVKLTPGNSKRGKAAKTAVNMFIHEKTTTPREKDILKAVKEEQTARNLPGKVKLSAPRLQALRK